MGIRFVLALLALVAFLSTPPVLAAGIEATDPITNEVGVDLDANTTATYTGAISPATITTATWTFSSPVSHASTGASPGVPQ